MKSVMVNGQPWQNFDAAAEIIGLRELQGAIRVEATY